MPELRKDPVTGRWVIISTDRRKRPHDFHLETPTIIGARFCPFCPGQEGKTPPEVLSYRQNGGAPNSPGWDVRVVPNRFPALHVEGSLDRQGEGLFDRMNGVGAHEVIIETPEHGLTLSTMSDEAVEKVLSAYRDRVVDLKQDRRFKYILIFKNHGAYAGASLEHGHSQLIALPIVPRHVQEEIDGARQHWAFKERCIFCDIVRQEIEAGVRVIVETADFVALSPYAAAFSVRDVDRAQAARRLLRERTQARIRRAGAHSAGPLLQRMDKALLSPPFNLIVHSSPFVDGIADLYHWHIEIIPKLTKVAGFEWGTGFYINPTGPEEAAQVLRDARV